MLNKNHKAERAKLFMPFDSLTGFRACLKEKERTVMEKKVLSEYDFEQLNRSFMQLKKLDIVSVVYFEQGAYIAVQGMVSKLDLELEKTIYIVHKKIYLHDIIEFEIVEHYRKA